MVFKIGDTVNYEGEQWMVCCTQTLGIGNSMILKKGGLSVSVYGGENIAKITLVE